MVTESKAHISVQQSKVLVI